MGLEIISQHYGPDPRIAIMQNLDGINQPYTCEQWADFGGIESYNLVDDGESYELHTLFSTNGEWHSIAVFDPNMVFRYYGYSPPEYLIDNLIEEILSESSWLLGDSNNDSILDILDVVIIVNHIINQDAYNYFSDINQDSIINIQDIILLINIIIDN